MSSVVHEQVGETPDGKPLELYTLTHPQGMRLRMLNWGACLTQLEVPDRHGKLIDVVLGLASHSDYLENNPFYIGASIGRTAGRIFPAEVMINSELFHLTQNEAKKHLHGGKQGLHNRFWDVVVPDASRPAIRLETELPDDLEGYPGTVSVSLLCEWSDASVLHLELGAETDKTTLFNPSRHDYFNLGGHDFGPIGPHVVQLPQTRYLPVDDAFVENLPPREVAGTPLDFREPKPLGDPLTTMEPRLRGINYAFLNDSIASEKPVAEIRHPATGIRLRYFSNQKTLQFYTGNFLDGSIPAKGGVCYGQHHGFCLEAMNFANGIHTSEWAESCLLCPGEQYLQSGTYHFDD